MKLSVDTDRAINDLRALARFGALEKGVDRRALTKQDIEARRWLATRMQAAGLETSLDEIGTLSGRTPACEQYVLVGSHTDTVPKGGWLDGSMGVIYGLELARSWVESKVQSNIGIEVISFSDEEGRFGGLMGSGVFAGKQTAAAARALTAEEGMTLGAEVDAAGWSAVPAVRLDKNRHRAYFEAHIEQGPILETQGKRIGVVTEIVGVERMRIEFSGRAEHAGTIPMEMRQDAAAAVFAFANKFFDLCQSVGGPHTVWNLGHVEFEPGAYNVVCGHAVLYIEYRDGDPKVLQQIREEAAQLAADLARAHRVSFDTYQQMRTEPAVMNGDLMRMIEDAADECGASSMRMRSGAGHDAMFVAPHIPTAMLFVPSIDGRSHDVSEDTSVEDIALGLTVLARAVERCLNE
ncbi:MAG: M20 family metallo-hydrolase [Gammaproteobacteria bacterium]